MQRFDTHLCLVSAQATPNLLPLLDDRWRPQRVVLACSAKMQRAAASLTTVVKSKGQGIAVELFELPDAYEYAALSEVFLQFLAEHEADDIALNVTGGTKLMAVAAQEAFRSAGKAVFYVNVESDEVLVIGEHARSQPLQTRLRVHELLEAHGYEVIRREQPQVRADLRDFGARLIDRVESAGAALGWLNALASQAKHEPGLRVTMSERQDDSRLLGDVIGLFEDAGQLRRKGRDLIFSDEAARVFVNGGWIETQVYEALQSLRSAHPLLTDVAMNLHVRHPNGRTDNEIDVAFLYRNTLHLIECKTANLAQPGHSGEDKATEAVYKLETLLKLGGLRTRGMIVDYRGGLAAGAANIQRARSAGIEVIAGSALKDLKGQLARRWLTTARA